MDATPEKKHTRPSSLSKFEDSPVFNFINSLSPIKPVKSIHTAQTFNSISFPAIPSVFTSPPHIISPHKEFKSPRRPNLSNPSKSVSPFKDGTAVSTNEGAVMILDRLLEIFVPEVSLGDDISKVSNPTIKAPENVNGQSSENVPLGDEEDRNCQTDKEGAAPEWESSMGDAGEILLLSTCPISAEAMEAIQKGAGFVNPNEADGDPWLLHRGGSEAKVKNMQQGKKEEDDEGYANSNEFMGMNTVDRRDDKVDNCLSFENKALSNLQRGMRRRCLDFEMAGTLRKTAAADDGPNQVSASSSASANAFRCTLPGIGLHLNALAATLKRCNQHSDSENLSSETDLTLPISYAPPFYAANSTQQQLLLPSTTPQKESPFQENPIRIAEDPSQTNPKKNGKWMENSGDGACKRCNCKKSRCLKLYCECFAAGVYCIEPCSCQDCYNKPIHEGVVLETRRQIESRNPLAFAPKVILNSDSASELGDDSNKTPASARHKRGCNCKKSSCLKKYCECYQGGVGCSINCRCEGCKNAFGRKDDSALIAIETEQEEEERELCQKSTETQNDKDQQNPSNAAPLTPVGPCRSLIPLPFPLKRKLPSSFLDERSSSRLSVRYKFEKQSIVQTDPKFEKSTCEDEMPETLCTGCFTSSTGVKSVSPNSKRVTLPPPRGDFGQSPSARIGRKLILQSVPSFPSLTNQNSRVNGPSKL